jgi:hypothetical protein
MDVPNSSFTQIITTTFRKVRDKMADNLSDNNVIVAAIDRAGGVRDEVG